MSRLLTIVALAAAICTACGQTPTASTAVATTTTAMPQPTNTPTTPPPPIPNPTEKRYFLNNTDNTVCLRLDGGFSIEVNYTATGSEVRVFHVDFGTGKVEGSSTCNAATKEAELKLEFETNTEKSPYYVDLKFEGHGSTWNVTEITVQFTYNASDFPGYIGPAPPTTDISSTSMAGLFEADNLNLKQSFICNANRKIMGFDPITPAMDVSLFVSGLRAQAFNFSHPTTGEFDAGTVCTEDQTTGNKIVPIAVGAALAGLVIVVLIAYLIGRLRNRRKSSYEALS